MPTYSPTPMTRSQLAAWAGVTGGGLVTYTTNEPNRLDWQTKFDEWQRATLALRDFFILTQKVQALTDAATIAWDMSAGPNATLTLTGNHTLGAPSNIIAGSSGVLIITQDGTGGRTLAYNAVWKFPVGAPTLQTAAGAKDVLYWYSPDGTNCYACLRGDGSNFVSGKTGTGNVVLATSPALVTPALGTPASGNLSNCTSLNASQLASGTVPVARLPAGMAFNLCYAAFNPGAEIKTSSTTYVTSGIAVTIPVSNAGNKVRIRMSGGSLNPDTDRMLVTLKRGSTDLTPGGMEGLRSYKNTSGGLVLLSHELEFYDTPGASGSTTYTVYFASVGGGNVYFHDWTRAFTPFVITAEEIQQ
jgi:hypothetical protein